MTNTGEQGSQGGGAFQKHRGFPSSFVDEVRHAISISAIVQEHVTLKRAGRTLKGLCPFHGEKTPSFHVDEAKGFYHCFGCGEGGDVFKFVQLLEGMSFPESVRHLAGKAGLVVPERQSASPQDALRERVLDINRAAQELFQERLLKGNANDGSKDALAYLERRGIGRDVVESFGMGWAPESWDCLLSQLRDRFEMRELTASGMVVPRNDGSGGYDRFRQRITFPIRALSDRIVGFGGRIVGDGEPKYLNSPETPVYTKGQFLFGLDRARSSIRKQGHALIVEGYLDVISLHAHGVETATAVLGTALTPEQARLLSRFTSTVVLNFDGDEAGLRATRKSIEVLLEAGLEVKVLQLPGGADPDDHVREVGSDEYLRQIGRASTFLDFLLECTARDHDLESPSGRVSGLSDLLPCILKVEDRVLLSELADAAAHGLGVRPELVRDEVRRASRRERTGPTPGGTTSTGLSETLSAVLVEASQSEKTLISWLLSDERARDSFRAAVSGGKLDSLPRSEFYRSLLDQPSGAIDLGPLIEGLDDVDLRQLVSWCAVEQDLEPVPREDLDTRVLALAEDLGTSPSRHARRKKAVIEQELAAAIARGDGEAARGFRDEIHELAREMHT